MQTRSYFNAMLPHWVVGVLHLPSNDLNHHLAYVSTHAGETERHHFLHALTGWELYCQAVGQACDPELAREALLTYLEHLRVAWAELETIFSG